MGKSIAYWLTQNAAISLLEPGSWPSKSFDGNGNYSLGLSEQLVFPELNPDKYLRP